MSSVLLSMKENDLDSSQLTTKQTHRNKHSQCCLQKQELDYHVILDEFANLKVNWHHSRDKNCILLAYVFGRNSGYYPLAVGLAVWPITCPIIT